MGVLHKPSSSETIYKLRWAKSKYLLDEYIQQYNEGKSLRHQLRAGHRRLAEHLLYLHQIELAKFQAYSGGLQEGMELPMLRTNNEQLLGALGCSERTVMYLRKRLMEAGIITKYEWHGSNSGYELALNPMILHLAPQGTPDNLMGLFRVSGATAAGGPPQATPMQNLRHTIVSCTGQETNKLNKLETRACPQSPENAGEAVLGTVGNPRNDVDKSQLVVEPGTRPDTGKTGYETADNSQDTAGTPPPVPAAPPANAPELSSEDAAALVAAALAKPWTAEATAEKGNNTTPAAEKADNGIPEVAPERLDDVLMGLSAAHALRLRLMVATIWDHAHTVLYRDVAIEEPEAERGRARLAEYFVYTSPERWAAGMQELLTRIDLVAAWIARGNARPAGVPRYNAKTGTWSLPEPGAKAPGRFVALPSLYFDIRATRMDDAGKVVPNYFVATKPWYKRHVAAKAEIAAKAVLTKSVREYLKAIAGAELSASQETYRRITQRLGKISPELVKRFHGMVDAALQAAAQNTAA